MTNLLGGRAVVMLRSALHRACVFTSAVGVMAMVFPTGDAYALTASVFVNQPTFVIGQTLSITAGLTNPNPGLPGTADVYLGLVRPDKVILFFTGTGIVIGNLTNLASFRPIATSVPLTSSFAVNQPNFYSHQWGDSDPRGAYLFFVGVVKTGALAGGVIRPEDIVGLATASFTFTGGPGTIQYRVNLSGNQVAIGSTVPVAFDYSYPSESGTLYTLTVGDTPNQPFGKYTVCYRSGGPTPSARFLSVTNNAGATVGTYCAEVTLSPQNPIGTFTFNFTL